MHNLACWCNMLCIHHMHPICSTSAVSVTQATVTCSRTRAEWPAEEGYRLHDRGEHPELIARAFNKNTLLKDSSLGASAGSGHAGGKQLQGMGVLSAGDAVATSQRVLHVPTQLNACDMLACNITLLAQGSTATSGACYLPR